MLADAIRSLRAGRGVTIFILFILTLTTSAATVTFSVVDAVVLRPLPFDQPDDLIVIDHHRGDGVMSQARALSALQFLALRDRTDAFSALAAVARGSETLQPDREPERIVSARVTASLFDALRVRPFIGQPFSSAHEVAGNDRVAVISHGLWRRRFGSDAAIVGQTIQVAGGPLLVIGVMPEGFTYPIFDDRLADIWTPYVIPDPERSTTQQNSYLHIVGRLRSGTSHAQAQTQADAVRATLAAAEPDRYRTGRFAVTTLEGAVVGPVRAWMLLVLFAVGLLVVVACTNVANLLLTRTIHRARELAIRAALGATRRRLVASLLVESLVLSLCAMVLALVIAAWGIDAAKASLPPGIARAHSIALDFRVFGAAVAAAVVTGLLFGVIPALQASRQDLFALVKQGMATTAGRNRWRASVLVAEIAFAAVLLVATTLFVSSFIRLTRADLGFDRSDLLVVTSLTGLQGPVTDFVQRLESIPGVAAVGGAAAGSPPLVAAGFAGGSSGTRLQLPDTPAGGEFVSVEFNRVSAGYFSAASIPVLQGRVFAHADLPTSTMVVLDELAARQLFGDRDPIGREVIAYGRTRVTVLGIVANVRMRGPEADSSPQAYFPGPATADSYAYLVRTSHRPTSVISTIQSTIATLRPEGSPAAQVRLVEDAFRNITARRRFSASSMTIFGILTILIGAAGVYGVMSSVVAQRTREIGVRMALGAARSQIVGAVLGQISRYMVFGLMLGLPLAWLISRTFAALFFQVRPTDLWIYLVVAGVLAVVGLVAAFIPARRASLVDPLIALRAE